MVQMWFTFIHDFIVASFVENPFNLTPAKKNSDTMIGSDYVLEAHNIYHTAEVVFESLLQCFILIQV